MTGITAVAEKAYRNFLASLPWWRRLWWRRWRIQWMGGNDRQMALLIAVMTALDEAK